MLSPRPEKRCTTESTSRRLPAISFSRACLSPARARSRSVFVSALFRTGSSAVFTPQISTFPCIKENSTPENKSGVSISRRGKKHTAALFPGGGAFALDFFKKA